MEEQVTRELERASALVLAPPNIVTHEQRQAAENVIMEFRKTKHPYNICKYILENCKIDYALFQAATTVKESIIREWSLLSSEDIESLRSFLLRFITQHISLQSYVREQILQTVAVILKRGTLDSKGASLDALFQDVTHLISSGNVTMQLVACSMLTALLNEYSSSSRTSTVGFTLEFHLQCKHSFEMKDLKRVLLFSLQVLQEIEKQTTPLPRETIAVLNRFLTITEQVLCWDFTPKIPRRHGGSFYESQNVTLKPHPNWRSTLLDKSLLQLVFNIHKKARHNSEMAHHSIQCLTQLASLNGPIFLDDTVRTEYLTAYIEGFLHILSGIDVQDFECLGIASMFKNLVMMFPSNCLVAIPPEHFTSFLDHLKRLTCAFGREAALEEEMHKEDMLHLEAYEKMLETWMEFISRKTDFNDEMFQVHARDVFTSYLECHISPPDGCRMQNTLDGVPDDEDIDEIEEDDRDKFADQLCCVGALARLVPEHSISMVTRALEDRIKRFHGQLQRIHQERVSSGNLNISFDCTVLNVLQEDLHWLILIAAHILTEEAEGETPMIPASIMQFSIQQADKVDLHTTLKVLASPSEATDHIAAALDHTDSVIRLISAVFRQSEVERQAIVAKMSDTVSPQVASSTMWFLRRWSRAYLLPEENYYSQVSKSLWAAFGRDTEGAQWTVTFLLDKVHFSLTAWSAEDKLLTDILQLLVSLMENKTKAAFMIRCEGLWNIARQEATDSHTLPASTKRLLFKALVTAGSAIKEEEMKTEYWNLVLQSLQDKFYRTVCTDTFKQTYDNVVTKQLVVHLLESLCGVAEGSRVDNLYKLFEYLIPMLQQCVVLLDVYHDFEDIVPLIIDLSSEVVQKQLCFLGEAKCKRLYEVCLAVIETYTKHNTGKRVQNASNEEEDRYNDILLLMELLTNLLSKDFLDFGDDDTEKSPSAEEVKPVDVVLYGLNTVIPLMSEDLLRFPTLCSQYFKLVTFLAEIHPNKFESIPPGLFKNLMLSIEMGLSSYGADITKLCLESLGSLAEEAFKNNNPVSPVYSMLEHFLKVVFRMLLMDSFNMELLDTASDTLFCLICCHQEQYRHLVNEILTTNVDEVYKGRLLEAFNKLTPPTLNLTMNRQNKIVFMQNFDQFLNNVRGFLCVR